jgi:hypothetical protein
LVVESVVAAEHSSLRARDKLLKMLSGVSVIVRDADEGSEYRTRPDE